MSKNTTNQEFTPDHGIIEVQDGFDKASPNGLYLSDDTSDESPLAYHFIITFNKKRYFARELKQEIIDEYQAKQTQLDAKNEATKKDGQAFLPGGRPDHARRKAAKERSPQLLSEQQGIVLWILSQAVVGWTRPMPFSTDGFTTLTHTARMGIAAEIIKGSIMGGDADPLANSS